MSPTVAVVILNWNGARMLPACLSALALQSYRDFELILVDNGSIDGSDALLSDLVASVQPPWLLAPLPGKARVVRNLHNVGFAAGNNQAFRLAHSKYIATLNNDAIPEPEWLAGLVSAVETGGKRVGMVASTMLFANRPDMVASAGISVHRDGVALDRGVGLPASKLRDTGLRPVFGASAGAALYRSAMLRDVGAYDERFFSYLEDTDLAWRARWQGWRALHEPASRVTHEYSATGGHDSPFKRFHISRNRVWTIYKNMPEAVLARVWPRLLLYDLLATANAALRNDPHLIMGRITALRRLSEFTEDRRRIASSARLHPDELLSMLAPPLSPRQTLKLRRRISLLLASPRGTD